MFSLPMNLYGESGFLKSSVLFTIYLPEDPKLILWQDRLYRYATINLINLMQVRKFQILRVYQVYNPLT